MGRVIRLVAGLLASCGARTSRVRLPAAPPKSTPRRERAHARPPLARGTLAPSHRSLDTALDRILCIRIGAAVQCRQTWICGGEDTGLLGPRRRREYRGKRGKAPAIGTCT